MNLHVPQTEEARAEAMILMKTTENMVSIITIKLSFRAAVADWVRHADFTQRSWVRIPLRSRLEGSQCHPPLQGGTGCCKMDDISLPLGSKA